MPPSLLQLTMAGYCPVLSYNCSQNALSCNHFHQHGEVQFSIFGLLNLEQKLPTWRHMFGHHVPKIKSLSIKFCSWS